LSCLVNEVKDSADFLDPSYGQTIISNTEKSGKAGLTAKAAAKLMKAGLKKMGKKAYTKIAKTTGLQAVGLNWTAINKVANYAGNFGGKIETALKKVGLNNYWAGVASRVISDVCF